MAVGGEGIGFSGRLRRPVRSQRANGIRLQTPSDAWRANPIPAVLALAGVFLPSELQISIGGSKFTPGRTGVALLFIPALVFLCQKGRRLLLCDFIVCLAGAWIVLATTSTVGFGGLFAAAGGETLEFVGGYFVARAFFFGPPALHTFLRVLKVSAITSILLGVLDSVSGRLVVHRALAPFVNAAGVPNEHFRGAIARATSTFDHPILFGTFCCILGIIFLYTETVLVKRIFWVGLSVLGCLVSQSSAALLAFAIVLLAYAYDRLLFEYRWRWIAFWSVLAVFFCVIFAVTNKPIGWVLSHMTFDPQTGYYRILIWDTALPQIMQSPLIGHSFNLFNDPVLDVSVDCVWLVFALRFGVPTIAFLFLANLVAVSPIRQNVGNKAGAFYMNRARTAFSVVLVMFMVIGLTVHYWNFMWIFWGLCLGIRVSLREWLAAAGRPVLQPRRRRIPAIAPLKA